MRNEYTIQLNNKKNVASTDVDEHININLENNIQEITEYDIKNIINVTEIFEIERQSTEKYRIYGKIELFSMLNKVKMDYSNFTDFLKPDLYSNNTKDIYNSFKFYLVRPANKYDFNNGELPITYYDDNIYQRKFVVISEPINFNIFDASFSVNVYGEPVSVFTFDITVDISNMVDGFGFPLTELYLFSSYQKNVGKTSDLEKTYYTNFGSGGYSELVEYTTSTYSLGDIIRTGDLVYYDKPNYTQTEYWKQWYYITTICNIGVDNNPIYNTIQWKYNPLLPIKLRYLGGDLKKVNVGSSDYNETTSIPYYATNLNDGVYVWREIQPEGYVDSDTGNGNDVPFVNKRRYIFSDLKLNVVPDMDDTTTKDVFIDILFPEFVKDGTKNLGDNNDINKPC